MSKPMACDKSIDPEIPRLVNTYMEFIRTAVAAGSNATIGASGATVLRNGRSFRQLVTPAS